MFAPSPSGIREASRCMQEEASRSVSVGADDIRCQSPAQRAEAKTSWSVKFEVNLVLAALSSTIARLHLTRNHEASML